jgi:hypothetical protein
MERTISRCWDKKLRPSERISMTSSREFREKFLQEFSRRYSRISSPGFSSGR